MHPRASEVPIDITVLTSIDLDGLSRVQQTIRTPLRLVKLPTNPFHAFYILSICTFATGRHGAAGHHTCAFIFLNPCIVSLDVNQFLRSLYLRPPFLRKLLEGDLTLLINNAL